jgi:hypothetical protein
VSDLAAEFIARLDRVADRLHRHATTQFPGGALTAPDPPTGERWEVGQVWAHLAEFIPYWLGEAALVMRGNGEPVPFGRTKTDPGRVAAIERDRRDDRVALWNRVQGDIVSLRAFLEGLTEASWSARGLHPTLGEMDLAAIIDEFLVGHLEQHADQLDGLAAASTG